MIRAVFLLCLLALPALASGGAPGFAGCLNDTARAVRAARAALDLALEHAAHANRTMRSDKPRAQREDLARKHLHTAGPALERAAAAARRARRVVEGPCGGR